VVREEAPDYWIDPDLEPMYELERRDYERIINRMTNVMISAMLDLHMAGRREAADRLRRATARVLADYDVDVAELILSQGRCEGEL
jgi:hypothetical protein